MDDRLTMWASSAWRSAGRNARQPCTTPHMLMSTIQRRSSSDSSSNAPAEVTPALFTRMLAAAVGVGDVVGRATPSGRGR